jgi:hypothetical protein
MARASPPFQACQTAGRRGWPAGGGRGPAQDPHQQVTPPTQPRHQGHSLTHTPERTLPPPQRLASRLRARPPQRTHRPTHPPIHTHPGPPPTHSHPPCPPPPPTHTNTHPPCPPNPPPTLHHDVGGALVVRGDHLDAELLGALRVAPVVGAGGGGHQAQGIPPVADLVCAWGGVGGWGGGKACVSVSASREAGVVQGRRRGERRGG